MPDERLPSSADQRPSTPEIDAERDAGKPAPNSGLERRQERNSQLTEEAKHTSDAPPAPDPKSR